MKPFSLLPVALMTWCAALAVAQADVADHVLATLPQCALPCVLTIFTSGTCSTDSIAPCICTNTVLQANISACAQTSCSFEDQLNLSNWFIEAVAVECDLCTGYPRESRSNEVKLTAIICSAIVYPIVLLRFFSRIHITRKLWMDDYIIMAAAVAQAGIAGLEIVGADMGFGMHYWQINPANGSQLLKFFWITQMLYIFIQVFAKVAILLLLGRVFTTPGYQMLVKIFSGLLVLHAVIFFFVDTFQCVPVAAIWDRTITAQHCVDVTAMGYAGASFSIVEDVLLLLLPLPGVWKLQMNMKKRIGVLALFGLGSFACLTSIIRLKYLVKFNTSFDSTWDNVDVVQWSVIEEFSAILCGSLPALWPLVTRLAPHASGTSVEISDKAGPGGSSRPSPSFHLNRRSQSGMTGMTEFGGSDEELQQLPDKASSKGSQSERPPATPPGNRYGVESYSVHHHVERIMEP